MKNYVPNFEEFLNESNINEGKYSGMSKDLEKLEDGEELLLNPEQVKYIIDTDSATVFQWFRKKEGILLGKFTNKARNTFACYKISGNEISIKIVDKDEELASEYKKK